LDSAGFAAARIERRWGALDEREWLENNAIWLKEKNERNNHSNLVPGGNGANVVRMPEGDTAVYES
jgi:hypothetical protein